MRRIRLGAFVAVGAIVVVGVATGVAPAATSPTATAVQAFAQGSPSAIPCGGAVDTQVTVNTQAGTSGAATNVMLVLDDSGSINSPPSKFTNLKQAALDSLIALDAADGSLDQSIAGNRVGLTYYRGSTATVSAALGTSYSGLVAAVAGLPTPPNGSSPHNVGINTASTQLAAGDPAFAKAMVLITDGQATGSLFASTSLAATNAKDAGVRIVPIGIGTGADVSTSNLTAWGSQPSYYQSGTAAPISKTKLVEDLGALVSLPTTFTLTQALGSKFSATSPNPSVGSVTTPAGSLVWTATVTGNQSATLTYRAQRNGTDVFGATTEVVSTTSLVVAGGTATVTPPASLSIDVLPCGGSLIQETTCTGAACTASGSSGGTQYTLNAGTPPAGTSLVLAGLNAAAPPAGACPGFAAHTTGAQFDIRPLAGDATLQLTIPKAALGTLKWWQTDVCLGTNMRFITAIDSLANLRPSSALAGGGAIPARWWGLLPSIPRFAFIPGLGFVRGPYITSRAQDSAGNAVITFKVPFVAGSAPFTTDGTAAYDPKFWG